MPGRRKPRLSKLKISPSPMSLRATTLRRAKLLNSVADLRAKLDLAKREHEQAESELRTLEPAQMRDAAPPLRKLDHIDRRAQ